MRLKDLLINSNKMSDITFANKVYANLCNLVWYDYINDEGDELCDLICDNSNIEEIIIKQTDNDKLKNALDQTLEVLDEREREIIVFYFGLDYNFEAMTLEDIGDKFDLTKERIRQIKEKAIRKLRHNTINLQKILDK